MGSEAPTGKKQSRRFGRQPKRPVTVAPEFLELFADVAMTRRRAFLAAYVQESGHIPRAKKAAAGGALHTIWQRDDPDYRAAFERAKRMVADAAERRVCRRAGRRAPTDARLLSVLRYMRRTRVRRPARKPRVRK